MRQMNNKNELRVALLCSGIGRVFRGFESFTEELFFVLKKEINATLFKGRGESNENEVMLRCIKRDGLLRILPVSLKTRRSIESFSFVVSFVSFLIREKFNVLIVSESFTGTMLIFLRKMLRLHFVVIIFNGGPQPPAVVKGLDFILQVTEPEYKRALEQGVSSGKMQLLPYGIFAEKFNVTASKNILRTKYSIPPDRYVLLAVGQVNAYHKRLDFLINCVEKVDQQKYFLLMVGSKDYETEEIKKLAKSKLGKNCLCLVDVQYGLMPEIYSLADCLIHCSLIEGFGRIFLEAMSAKIPLIAHRMDIIRWVVDNEECLIDMQQDHAVIEKIKMIANDESYRQNMIEKNYNNILIRFDWDVLRNRYVDVLKHAWNQREFVK